MSTDLPGVLGCRCVGDALSDAVATSGCPVHGECHYPMLHRYTEASARAKLARHRRRGDVSRSAVGCPGFDHWHVVGADSLVEFSHDAGCECGLCGVVNVLASDESGPSDDAASRTEGSGRG